MHELSVTQAILEVVLRHAQAAQAGRVQRIYLRIGDLSGIVDDSVQFYFDFLSRGTIAAGAELVFERVPARFRCPTCGEEFTPTAGTQPGRDLLYLPWACPSCGELYPEVIGGKEFLVESIEVD